MRVARMVSPGHPDKACDLIAATVVDEYLRRDAESRVRLHVTGGAGALFISGMAQSKADFDVGAVASRTAAALGARKPVEPFVAIEAVAGARAASAFRRSRPLAVAGYATVETPERAPAHVALARRIAKKLEELRTTDAEWFWLEPGFEVSIAERAPGEKSIFIACAHGEVPVGDVRDRIRAVIMPFGNASDIRVNADGPLDAWSLDTDIGSSGTPTWAYGSGLTILSPEVGCDPVHPATSGTWLARALAREALARTGMKAVLVRAVYGPADASPMSLIIRDNRDRDVSQPDDLLRMSLDSASSFLRPGLGPDAVRWGFAGEAGMPWEE